MGGKRKSRICLVTAPRPGAGVVPLRNLVEILQALADELYVVTGNEGVSACDPRKAYCYSVDYVPGKDPASRIIKYVLMQFMFSFTVFRVAGRGIDAWIFFMSEGMLMPLLLLKLLGKRVVLSLASSSPSIVDSSVKPSFFDRIAKLLELANYSLADRIVLYSERLVSDWGLNNYRDKIVVARRHFIDFGLFQRKKSVSERENLVAYLGRLSYEKGVLNFVESIPAIVKGEAEAAFLIGGEGVLMGEIESRLAGLGLGDSIDLIAWISHERLPYYLNEVKLLVIPSYTEGLPTIMLEAMACGAIVVAAPVGAIPDFLKDGKTGFLLEDNSPECIAETVLSVLGHTALEEISVKASEVVSKECSYEVARRSYREVLQVV